MPHPRCPDGPLQDNGRRHQKILSGLNPNKSAGPDKLQPQVLENLADVLATMVTFLYNASKKQQIVLKRLEDYKRSSNIQEVREVQGIQLPPCFPHMRPMHIVASQVMQHLTKNNILFNHQHGFRSKLSTETQLIQFTNDMLRGRKRGSRVM